MFWIANFIDYVYINVSFDAFYLLNGSIYREYTQAFR